MNPLVTVKTKLTEDLKAAIDLYRVDYDMSRYSFTRLLLRKGFATLGVTAEDIANAPALLGRRIDSAATESE